MIDMKKLKITKRQKENLLEMCNKLYPQDWLFWESESDDYPDGMLGYRMYSTKSKRDGEIDIELGLEIHWFELCMTNLYKSLVVLSPVVNVKNIENLFDVVQKGKSHPVDYLYKEFCRIKKHFK